MKLGSYENIKLGNPIPVVELDKINSIGRLKDIPSSDAPGLTVPVCAPDEETRATQGSNLSMLPGKAEYFEGRGLMRTVQESMKRQKMHSSHLLSATYTSHTCTFNLDNNSRYPSPSKSASGGLNKSYAQGRFTQPTQGGFKVHWQESYQ